MGTVVGCDDGSNVGWELGNSDGSNVGWEVGFPVGASVGRLVISCINNAKQLVKKITNQM